MAAPQQQQLRQSGSEFANYVLSGVHLLAICTHQWDEMHQLRSNSYSKRLSANSKTQHHFGSARILGGGNSKEEKIETEAIDEVLANMKKSQQLNQKLIQLKQINKKKKAPLSGPMVTPEFRATAKPGGGNSEDPTSCSRQRGGEFDTSRSTFSNVPSQALQLAALQLAASRFDQAMTSNYSL